MTAPNTPSVVLEPTQVRHPVRTIVRGLVQWVPPIAVAVPLIVQAVENGDAGLTGPIGAGAVIVATAITRVMAIPQVNELLNRAGLGATGETVDLAQAYAIVRELEAQDTPGQHATDRVQDDRA